jgi:hypothetical protein
VGEMLIGQVVDVAERTGFAGERYPLVTVEQENGERVAFHAFHAVAKDELARLRPKVGELIGIAYHGRDPQKGYERYRLQVVREESGEAPNWAAMRAVAESEQEAGGGAGTSEPCDEDIPF